jgi:hypothetical protein
MSSATSNKPSWTPGDEPSQKDLNLLNQRVIQFTDTEDTTLDVWLRLENANLDEEAAKFLNAGLLFEHYLSQLPNDPTQRGAQETEQLETYRRDFETALDQARSALASEMSSTGAYSKQLKASLLPTGTQVVTLTGWFYLVLHAYSTVAAGNMLPGFAYGLAAFAELFCGLTIARLFKK